MKIAWIGIGHMGKPMAKHMMTAAEEFTVHDLNPEAATDMLEDGANWADTPAEAASGKDLVVTCLPMPQHVDAVSFGDDGISEGVEDGAIVIDCTSNSLNMVQSLHQRYADQGITFLDAPVSGGVVGAQERDLAVYVGGDRGAYDAIKPTLDAMGDKVQYCGGIGTGTICKQMNQLFGAIVGMARMEVITAGVKAGTSFEVLVKAIHEGSGGKRRPFDGFERPPEDYDDTEYTFYLELMAKDVRLANEIGRSMRVPLPLGNLAEARMIEGLNRGWGKKRGEIIGEIQQQISNVDLKVDG
ncbi:MAG: NAD(P)-dependent oxidoreductase [Chloroflexi bacterium]|nr:NAD(P)-dependent oxidoreductase [Chloroflexota bacterium]MYK60529.1 NAD(P)-dependent oxidoreductase [Chloroflexota bacterium]